jgi:hypothetical protein
MEILRFLASNEWRLEALRMATERCDWFMSLDGEVGTLEVGKLADLIVLNRDSRSCSLTGSSRGWTTRRTSWGGGHRRGVAPRKHPGSRAPHNVSASQRATSGRALYQTLLQTCTPSSKTTVVVGPCASRSTR